MDWADNTPETTVQSWYQKSKNPQPKHLLDLIKEFSKIVEFKIKIQKSVAVFLHLKEFSEKEINLSHLQ